MTKRKIKPFNFKRPVHWDYDMSKAPRGKFIDRVQKNSKGVEKQLKQWVRDEIWVLGKCGTVTRSYWIPDEDRWCMFATEYPPIAWAEFTGERG